MVQCVYGETQNKEMNQIGVIQTSFLKIKKSWEGNMINLRNENIIEIIQRLQKIKYVHEISNQ